MKKIHFTKIIVSTAVGWVVSSVWAGNGGGLNSKPTPPQPPTPSPQPSVVNPDRAVLVNQIEIFTRSVLPAVLAAENGDESVLPFLKDRVTYFEALKKECAANKTRAESQDLAAVIKKLDPNDVTVDTEKREARVNVLGNLITTPKAGGEGAVSLPTLWIVSIRINEAGSPQSLSVSKIIAAKLP